MTGLQSIDGEGGGHCCVAPPAVRDVRLFGFSPWSPREGREAHLTGFICSLNPISS